MTDNRVYAVLGVSLTDPTKYGNRIFADLHARGFHVYAVNPKGGDVTGQPVYKTLADIPARVQCVIFVASPAQAMLAVEKSIENGVKEIYFQPGARDPQAFARAEAAGLIAHEACFMKEHGIW